MKIFDKQIVVKCVKIGRYDIPLSDLQIVLDKLGIENAIQTRYFDEVAMNSEVFKALIEKKIIEKRKIYMSENECYQITAKFEKFYDEFYNTMDNLIGGK